MIALRTARELLSYFILVCCGLLLTSVYFLSDKRLSTWILSSDVNEAGQSSELYQYSQQRNQNSLDTDVSQQSVSEYDKASTNRNNEEQFTNIVHENRDNFQIEDNPSLKSHSMLNNVDGMYYNADTNLQLLRNILEQKLLDVGVKKIKAYEPTCENNFKLANSCDNNTCLQKHLPNSPLARLKQLITPRKLQLSQSEHQILRGIADNVKDTYDIILLTAASSNHFLESQALLKNLHENVFPYLKNFTLIFYNLGLTERERILMVKYCKCQVLDFPFEKFPNFMTQLKCYSWKPVLIKAHLQKANVVFWMDASIRFHNSSDYMQDFIHSARERGVLVGGSSADSAFRTLRSMYHFFGDEPCAYLKLGQAHATFGVYHREYFVDRAILEPWVACAINEGCICPRDRSSAGCRDSKIVADNYYRGVGKIVYGMCHRFDQSALSIILHKLYKDYYRWIMVSIESVLSIKRRHAVVYFPED